MSSVRQRKRSRTDVSFSVKKEICQFKEDHPGKSQEYVAAEIGRRHGFKIGRSTVGDILREKDKWLSVASLTSEPSSKRLRAAKHEDMEKALFMWFSDKESRRVPISDEILREKAKCFGRELNLPNDFCYSRGWLEKFKKRYGIKMQVRHGEAGGVDTQRVEKGREHLREIVRHYHPSDVYNFDETGLFYRLEPNKTLAIGPVLGTKRCKDRITIALCTNADGSHKLKPFVIGKSAKPRCFPSKFDVQKLVTYRHNKKAWMTALLFRDFLLEFDRQMKAKNRNVLLLLDNASSHSYKDISLSNTTLEFLPPATTSHLQPLDAGIIQNFKVHYKTMLMR